MNRAGMLFLITSLVAPASVANAASPGAIIGHLDGVSRDGSLSFLSGWACQRGEHASIAVHVFSNDGSATGTRTFVTSGRANLANEPEVNRACADQTGSAHRFLVVLPPGQFPSADRTRIYLNGIHLAGTVPNSAISGSGELLPELAVPASFPHPPPIAGSYRPGVAHPRVFTTPAELGELAARINRPDTYSRARFDQLSAQVRTDLSAHVDWNAAYSGCRLKTYLFAFSYEPQEAGFAATLRSDLSASSGATPPAGAAVVAARVALYAALVRAGASAPAAGPSAGASAALARRILLAWADHGFRTPGGGYRTLADFDCDDDGKPYVRPNSATGLGLALGRGVVYSVDAQDLLMGIGTLSGDEARRLDAFHAALATLIRQSSNTSAGTYEPACIRFSNLQANALVGLLAIARLRDDARAFKAALTGGDANWPVFVPWTVLFDRAIYGRADTPNACFTNTGPDALTSRPSFQTSIVAPGEIDDRFRNGNPAQGIGYPMFTLERLINAAEVLRLAGYEPYRYRGSHGQSIAMAIGYYGCLAAAAGFRGTVTAANAATCPDGTQYTGKIVNGVEPIVLFGAAQFPTAKSAALENSARSAAATGPFGLDPLMFGLWRD